MLVLVSISQRYQPVLVLVSISQRYQPVTANVGVSVRILCGLEWSLPVYVFSPCNGNILSVTAISSIVTRVGNGSILNSNLCRQRQYPQ